MNKFLPALLLSAFFAASCSQFKERTVVTEADTASLPSPGDLAQLGVLVRPDWKEKRTIEKSGRPVLYVQLTARYYQDAYKGSLPFMMNVVVQQYNAWSSAKAASFSSALGLKQALEPEKITLTELESPEGQDWGSDFKFFHLIKDGKPMGCAVSTRSGAKNFLLLLKGLYFESAKDKHFKAFFDTAFSRFRDHSLAKD